MSTKALFRMSIDIAVCEVSAEIVPLTCAEVTTIEKFTSERHLKVGTLKRGSTVPDVTTIATFSNTLSDDLCIGAKSTNSTSLVQFESVYVLFDTYH